ncbi:MAG: Type secretion-associated serine protease mycosin [Frankiales bacterium]|nr:Type secretion-associated serine protease mycosin [Frankiales bacterium]
MSTSTLRVPARVLLAGLLAGSAVSAASAIGVSPALAAGVVRSTDPVPSASGQLVLVSSTARPASGGLDVVGEVRNDWNRVAGYPAVSIELLDASGTVLATKDASTKADALAPGEHSGFATYTDLPAGYASYRVKAAPRASSYHVPNHGFEVAVTGSSPSAITGTVKNTNTSAVNSPAVELDLRDAAGAVYDVDTAYVKGSGTDGDLVPGETVSFSVPRFSDDPFQSDGTITALAESSSDPSPFPTELGLAVPKLVAAGTSGTVTITVLGRGATGAAPAGVKVQLFGREARQPAFRLLRTLATTGSSTISFDLKPQRDIRWQARVPEAANATASASGYTLTQVAFGVSTTVDTPGDTATFHGGVRPASAGSVVYLQQQSGGVFRNVRSVKLSSSSTYSFTLKSPANGSIFRVYKPAVTGNQAGYGDAYRLTRYAFRTASARTAG